MKKILLLFFFIVLIASTVSAECTVEADKPSYFWEESATITMSCSEATEKSKAYNLYIYNGTSDVPIDIINGTTPATTGENFFESFTISFGENWTEANFTLIGTPLEGYDTFNTSIGTANALIISEASVSGLYLGLASSIDATVKDEHEKKITGGICRIDIEDNTGNQDVIIVYSSIIEGDIDTSFILNYNAFAENKSYTAEIACWCGSNSSETECIDEDSNSIENSVGTTTTSFTTKLWTGMNNVPFNTVYENGTDYDNAEVFAGFEEKIYYFVNITNNYPGSQKIYNLPILINKDTGETFTEPDEQDHTHIYSAPTGNNTYVVPFEISKDVPTGQYYITNYFDVYYQSLLVTQDIVNTEMFNVTGTDDTILINKIVTNKDHYYTGEELHACMNITNNFDSRIDLELSYRLTCPSSSNLFETTRTILSNFIERRNIGAEKTLYHCAEFKIPPHDHLLYKTTNTCKVSVTVQSEYINTFDNRKSLSSSAFSVIDFGMYPEYETNPNYPLIRLFPDWRRFDDVIDNKTRSYYRTKINITNINETKLDPDDDISDAAWDVYVVFSNRMPCSQEIYNYTVIDNTGTIIDNEIENKAITWKRSDDGQKIENYCAIGIENVNFSDTDDDYFEVRVWFEDFTERQTEALESINTTIWNQSDSLYLQWLEATNQSDSLYLSLLEDINQSDIFYQSLLELINQSGSLRLIANSSGNYDKSLVCDNPVYTNENTMDCVLTITRMKGGDKETYFRMKILGFDETLIEFSHFMYINVTNTFPKTITLPALTLGQTYTVEVRTCYDGFGLMCDADATTATFRYLQPTEAGKTSTDAGINDTVKDFNILETVKSQNIAPYIIVLVCVVIWILVIITGFKKKNSKKHNH